MFWLYPYMTLTVNYTTVAIKGKNKKNSTPILYFFIIHRHGETKSIHIKNKQQFQLQHAFIKQSVIVKYWASEFNI